jgi:hypothetical protein
MLACRGFGRWEAVHVAPSEEFDPMKQARSNSPTARQNNPASVAPGPDSPSRPSGKVGLIIQHLERKAGATVGELAEAAGWKGNSVRGALSRLRAQGFAMTRDTQGSRKAYRLDRSKRLTGAEEKARTK